MLIRTRPSADRRRFLILGCRAALLGALVPVLHGLGGCSGDGGDEVGDATLRLPLAGLPAGVRVRQELAGKPVEILRTGNTVTARSLMCTHQGCEVRWQPESEEYVCPCHDGRFDSNGRVVYGPPPHPLREIPVRLEQGTVIVGG